MAHWLYGLTMVIELTDSLIGCPPNEIDDLSLSVTNILIGYYEGNNIVIASYPVCDYFLGLINDERAQSALWHIRENSYIEPDVLWWIKVVLQDSKTKQHEIPFTFFNKTQSIQPPFIVGESMWDVSFYKYLASSYHSTAFMSCIEVLGGGDTTDEAVRSICRKGFFCLVIVDSDKKYSDCREGRTASSCRKLEGKYPNLHIEVLSVHEAENLIPIAFLEKKATKKGLDLLRRLKQKSRYAVLDYYDIKEGITKEALLEDSKLLTKTISLYDEFYPKNKKSIPDLMVSAANKDQLMPSICRTALKSFIEEKGKGKYPTDIHENYRHHLADLVYTYLCSRGRDPINP